jgi:hypothetical protein
VIVVSSIFVSILSHHSLFPLLQAAGPPVQLEPVDLSVKAPHSPAVVLQVPRYSPQLPTNGADLRLTYPGKLWIYHYDGLFVVEQWDGNCVAELTWSTPVEQSGKTSLFILPLPVRKWSCSDDTGRIIRFCMDVAASKTERRANYIIKFDSIIRRRWNISGKTML